MFPKNGRWNIFSFLLILYAHLCDCKVLFSVGNYASKYTPCGVSGNFLKVGFQGTFSGNVSGNLFIFDDCYFSITNFTYSSNLPTLTAFGGLLGQPPTATYAFLINPIELTGHSPSDTIIVYSQWGFATWDNIQLIYAWDSDGQYSYGEVALDDVEYTSSVQTRVKNYRSFVLKEAKKLKVLASPPPPLDSSPPPPPLSSPAGVGDYAGFDNCLTAIKDKLNIYWSVNETSGSGSEIELGIEARVGLNSWIGLGFSSNQTQFQMKDSDVTIVGWIEGDDVGFAVDFFITANQACQPIAGGYVGTCPDTLLGGSPTLNDVELISSIRKGDITFVRYKRPAKTLDSRWDMDLTLPLSLTSSRFVIFASGPLAPSSTRASPVLLNHDTTQGYFYNGTSLILQPVINNFSCSPLLGSKVQAHPILPPYTSPPPPASPPPPPSANACEKKINFKGMSYTFQACNYLNRGFVILWTLEDTILTAGFTADVDNSSAWVAVGLSPTGDVIGSSALVAVQSKSSQNQVKIDQYVFNGLDSNQVVMGGELKASKMEGEVTNSSKLTFFFTLDLAMDQTSAAYLVWTKGSSAEGSVLSQDGVDSALTSIISFKSGLVSTGVKPSYHLWKVHGSLAAVAWGVLLPLGAMLARYAKEKSPHWFAFHQAIQLVAFSLGQVAFVIAFTMSKKHHSLFSAHKGLGIWLFVITVIQVLAVVWKPSNTSKHKPIWKNCHLILAILILLFAIVQIFLGFQVSKAKHFFMYAYIVWIVFLFILFLSFELLPRLLTSRSGSESHLTFKEAEMAENGESKIGKTKADNDHSKPKPKPPQVREPSTEKQDGLELEGKEGSGNAEKNKNESGSETGSAKPSSTRSRNPFSGPLSENMKKFNLLPRRESAIKVDKYNVKATVTGTPDFLKRRNPPPSSSPSSSSPSPSSPSPHPPSLSSSQVEKSSIGTILENESTEK